MPDVRDRARGVLLGGAVGDALGAPVEFVREPERLDDRLGRAPAPHLGRPHPAKVTDDTQMTLFTAEALLRSAASGRDLDIETYAAYQRWLGTQGLPVADELKTGLLWADPRLHAQRAPGATCIGALRSGRPGTVSDRINDSMGCGGVMRTAPLGLVLDAETAFRRGCANAALTHGHDNGIAPAGALAMLVALLVDGATLAEGLERVVTRLRAETWGSGTAAILSSAVDGSSAARDRRDLTALLGEGWVGHEALAIPVACILAHPGDPATAMWAAANHPGDSDSTASIAGQILGALHGTAAVPATWTAEVELADLALRLADGLADLRGRAH